MSMRKVSIADLSEAVRSFLSEVIESDGVVIEDEAGRPRCGVIPYREASPEEVERANASLERLRRKAGQAMQQQGVSEEDVDRVLQEDE